MIRLTWITLISLILPATTSSQESVCDSSYTRLLLMVDTRHSPSIMKTRLKNIVSYFVTKVKDESERSLDVCLVDPFQEKTLFDLTDVRSTREVTFVINQHVNPNVSWDDRRDFSDFMTIYRAAEHSLHFIRNETAGEGGNKGKQRLVVFLSHCYNTCLLTSVLLSTVIAKFTDVWVIALLNPHYNVNVKRYNQALQEEYDSRKLTILVVDPHDDFTRFNPVPVYVCRDCPEGWKRYSRAGRNRLSCYFVYSLNTTISWSQAFNQCASIDSALPVAETEEELMFLIKLLSLSSAVLSTNKNGTETATVDVNVGLRKKFWPKRIPFFWLNLRPFSFGADSDETDDNRRSCVVLTYSFRTNTDGGGIRWTPVKCDEHTSRILICEMEMTMVHDLTEVVAQIRETVQESPRRSKFNQTKRYPITFIDELHEENWSMFDCGDLGEMVTYSSVCNGARNCRNGRDEEYCEMPWEKDKLGRFYCVNPNGVSEDHPTRMFIPSEDRCNLVQDCPDNSDELGCGGCLGRQCADGTCVPSHWVPDGHDGCHLIIGANRTVYLNVSYPCGGQCSGSIQFNHEISLCDRNSSVQDFPEGQLVPENLTAVLKWAPKCLYLGRGDQPGCSDAYHLRDCSTFRCPEGFFKCPDAYCVPVYNFKDGELDCPYGEDEGRNIDIFAYIDDMFHCRQSSMYVHQVHICDGVPQCPSGDDETDCPITCPPGFKCHGDAVAVSNHRLVPKMESLSLFDIKTRFLNISGVDLSDLQEFYILPNLLEIYAFRCNLVNLGNIFRTQHKNFKVFAANFSYNNLTEILDNGPFSNLINLQYLNLSHNEQLHEIKQGSIGSPKLHTLDLSFTGLTVFDLEILISPRSLRYLNLCHTKIAQIVSFQSVQHLEFLNLERTSLSKENMTMILKSLSVSSALHVDDRTYCCPQISGDGTPTHACRAPPDAISSCEDLLSDFLKRSLLWLVAGLSLAGNIIVITYRLFYDRGVLKKGYGIFVTNLSVSDLVMGAYLLIIASTDARYRDEYVLHEGAWRHGALCHAAGFLSTLSSEVSTLFVLLITLDRWLVIRYPFGDHRFTTLGIALSAVSSWVIGFILASVPLVYPEWTIYSSNGMCLGLPVAKGRHLGWHYSFGVFICFNFILFVCIAGSQMLIFRSITSSRSFQMTNAQSCARRMQDINVAKQLFLVALSNFLCWFPICVFGFLSGTGYEVSPDTYAWLVVFVMPMNAAVNPLIYTIPVIYSKWQDFKKGEPSTKTGTLFNKSITAETKM